VTEKFEEKLRADLPRGAGAHAERGLVARWCDAGEMTGDVWRYREDGLLLGRRDGRLIGWNDNRHMVTIAGSRAGKGVSLIVPNLIKYQGSAVVIDPKGENARITAGRRGSGTKKGGPGLGQDVYVIDPFRVSGRRSASFNPLAELNVRSDNVIEDASMFAEALIIHPDHDRHWTESAQALLRALILAALADPTPARRNLVTVRRLLTLTDERIRDLVFDAEQEGIELGAEEALIAILRAQRKQRWGYVCTGVAEQIEAMSEKERGSVLSSARTQTQWLDDPCIRGVLRTNDFRMADLKKRPTTIYLCLPAMRMSTHARWLRLMILHALTVMERTRLQPPAPVLFVLDEFSVLQHVQAIETAAGLMAGFGVKLWVILQNVGQLRQHYNKSWETFFANAGVITAFGVVDQESQKVLSQRLGKVRIVEKVPTGAVGSALQRGTSSQQEQRYNLPLLAEDEIGRVFDRDEERMLILGAGRPPAIAQRLIYHDKAERLFRGLYDEPRRYG
jgi:type IV secretion system protein VirD4